MNPSSMSESKSPPPGPLGMRSSELAVRPTTNREPPQPQPGLASPRGPAPASGGPEPPIPPSLRPGSGPPPSARLQILFQFQSWTGVPGSVGLRWGMTLLLRSSTQDRGRSASLTAGRAGLRRWRPRAAGGRTTGQARRRNGSGSAMARYWADQVALPPSRSHTHRSKESPSLTRPLSSAPSHSKHQSNGRGKRPAGLLPYPTTRLTPPTCLPPIVNLQVRRCTSVRSTRLATSCLRITLYPQRMTCSGCSGAIERVLSKTEGKLRLPPL